MHEVLSERVLVLNRSWVALNVATVRRALTMVCLDFARIVEPEDYSTHSLESWINRTRTKTAENGGGWLRAASFEMRLPEVIVLTHFNGYHAKEARCTRRNIFERDGNRCQYCGKRKDTREMTLDHILPRSRGGGTSWENMVLACFSCNSRKGDRLPQEAGMRLLTKPMKPVWANRLGARVGVRTKPSWDRFLDSGLESAGD